MFKSTDIDTMISCPKSNNSSKKEDISGYLGFGTEKNNKELFKKDVTIFRDIQTPIDKIFKDLGLDKNKPKYKGQVFGNINQFISKIMNDGRRALQQCQNNNNNEINFDYLIPNSEKFGDHIINKLQFLSGNDQQNAKVLHFVAYKLLKKDPFNKMGFQIYLSIPFDNRISKLLSLYSNICGVEDAISLLRFFPLIKLNHKEFYENVYDFIKTFRDMIVDCNLLKRNDIIIKDFMYTVIELACTEQNGSVNYKTMYRIFSTILLENKIPSNSTKTYKTADGLVTNIVFDLINNIEVNEIERILEVVNKNTRQPKHGCKALYLNAEDYPVLTNVVERMKLDRKLDNLVKYNK